MSGLREARLAWRGPRGRLREDAGLREFPSQESLRQIVGDLSGALFPMRLGPIDLREEVEDLRRPHHWRGAGRAAAQVCLELQYAGRNDPALLADTQQRAIGIVRQFGAELPKVREALDLT